MTDLLATVVTISVAQSPGRGTIQTISCAKDTSQQYALYVPVNYKPENLSPLIIFFDPGARGDVPVTQYRPLADEYGVVIAGSFNSKNFDEQSSVASFTTVYNDIVNKYAIDPARIWVAGFSGGSRAAADIAMTYPEINGIIACGAGFSGNIEATTANMKAYVAIVGDKDMNYGELMDNTQFLTQENVNNILLVFQGEHRWPPVQYVGIGIKWLLENTGTEVTALSVEEKQVLESIKIKADSGYLYQAWLEAGQLSKLKSYRDDAIALQQKIEKKENFTIDKKFFEKTATEETACMNEFSLSFSRFITGNNNVEKSVWMKIARQANAMREDNNYYRQMAGLRCYDHCTRSCYEQYFHLMAEKEYTKAEKVADVLTNFSPSSYQPYYFMARASAGGGKKKQCEKYLKQAIGKGLALQQIEKDKLLTNVFSSEEMKKIVVK